MSKLFILIGVIQIGLGIYMRLSWRWQFNEKYEGMLDVIISGMGIFMILLGIFGGE